MILCTPAVIKRRGKWFIGFIKPDGKFKEKKEIKKLSDVKEMSNYMTLGRFLKTKAKDGKYEMPKGFQEKVMKKLKAQSAYILDKPVGLSRKEWEQWWWAEFHNLCKKCQAECKQSHRVTIQSCSMLRGEL